jgi:uroporphyrinogen III methyltransferase/synthase
VTVSLVGAGPGDPELIAVAGLAALRQADVVVYDRLAAPALLREAPAGALLIDAGKAPGAHTLGQEAINAVLIEHARAGRTVVRLKGGDPFLFGRGGEEALALREHGIPFRVVPGVSSALAAPAYAGIPVTHRGVAGSVLVATGHEAEDEQRATSNEQRGGLRFDWGAVARAADTLVFLMGVERLGAITENLLRAGRPAEQPAALVRWGSTPEQAVLSTTLGTIAEEARAAGIRPPAALVVGEVVALRERLAWFETLPLFGARVLVTRTREQASGLVARLRGLGAAPLEFPAIACLPLDNTDELDAVLAGLQRHNWVVFTSQNGVTATFERLVALAIDARAFAGVRICAIGPATARALAEHGLRADLVPEAFTTTGVLAALTAAGVRGQRVLLLRADIAPPPLVEGLRAAGAEVSSVAAYRTIDGSGRRAELDRLLADGLDAVTFTSSSTVTHLLAALDGNTAPLADALIASIGPVTSATARAAGLRVDAEANPHTIDVLVAALCEAWNAHPHPRPLPGKHGTFGSLPGRGETGFGLTPSPRRGEGRGEGRSPAVQP